MRAGSAASTPRPEGAKRACMIFSHSVAAALVSFLYEVTALTSSPWRLLGAVFLLFGEGGAVGITGTTGSTGLGSPRGGQVPHFSSRPAAGGRSDVGCQPLL